MRIILQNLKINNKENKSNKKNNNKFNNQLNKPIQIVVYYHKVSMIERDIEIFH